ncbi:D-2-hydroxyacid dehydrogenase [Phytoactinopolyspora limicola]|uniref:D-2-hydroxyacid dehydrogenase n=1 Tax=Phytoactinopolyspora limicola TaxID=2715536 RepID=UPI00140E11CF|nr:D-2-hydroxyacid dehydrogenase [Phytoactinopolyspora limicola]
MSAPLVLVSERFAGFMIPRLSEAYPDLAFGEIALSDGTMRDEYLDAQIMLRSAMNEDVFRAVLDTSERLRWVQITAAGFDWLASDQLTRRVESGGLLVTRSVNSFNVPIAEYVVAAMFTVARRFPEFYEHQRVRHWQWGVEAGEIGGSTVGVFGTGAIGREVAWRCRALGARVIGVNRSGTPVEHFDAVVGRESFADVLPESDYVVLAMPLTPETHHMFQASELKLMKPDAVLINVGRGALVKEADLLEALNQQWIAGAVIDVFDEEPLGAQSPLWTARNALLTPHTSFRAVNNPQRLLADFQANLDRFLAGRPLLGMMKEPALGY